MSERYDGNDGWKVDDEGEVVPPDTNPPIKKRHIDENRRQTTIDPEFSDPVSIIEAKLDAGKAISQEEADILNSHAQDERGGEPPIEPR